MGESVGGKSDVVVVGGGGGGGGLRIGGGGFVIGFSKCFFMLIFVWPCCFGCSVFTCLFDDLPFSCF